MRIDMLSEEVFFMIKFIHISLRLNENRGYLDPGLFLRIYLISLFLEKLDLYGNTYQSYSK